MEGSWGRLEGKRRLKERCENGARNGTGPNELTLDNIEEEDAVVNVDLKFMK
jgi:hypothetical protein